MKSWLIQYRKKSGDVTFTEYDDHLEAMRERLRLDDLNDDYDLEIAVITGRSLDELRVSHERYFRKEIASRSRMKTV